jgi:hypothetical protein
MRLLALQQLAGNSAVGRIAGSARILPVQLQRAFGNAAVRAQRADGAGPPTMTPEEHEASAAALCIGDERRTGPPTRAFTSHEQSRITATRWAAIGLAGRAVQALSSHDRYMVTLARRILHEPEPDMNELASTAVRIHDALASTPVVCGTCAADVCAHSGGGSPLADADNGVITICPFFFHPQFSVVEQRRTWLHEAGHIVGIDDPPPGTPFEHPPNCPPGATGCDDPCPSGDKNNVDNWARLLECVAFRY